jgi:WD40-like Beta Propeller Repeat
MARVSRALLLAAFFATFPTPLSAQYFGRNKVQYKKLDFEVLKTDHFDIYFYPREREGVEIAARMAERWHARLERILNHQLRGRQPLVLYGSHPDFEQTNAIGGELSEGTGGVTEPLRRRIVLPLGGPLTDTDHVIGHELVHAFQFDMTTAGHAAGQNGAERLPLWFIEGMAEYLSLGPIDPNTAMWLRDAVRLDESGDKKDRLPSIDDLNNPKYFPYRWGQAFWAYVGGRFGDDVVRQMLAVGAAAGDPDVAIEKVLAVKAKDLSNDWHDAMRRAYAPVLAHTTPPAEIGRMVVKAEGFGDLNVGPSISPDGRWIAFMSTREVFSIDLFVADAATGKVVHKLTSTASDPHFSSIEFIYSAGGWDAESKRIAVATVTGGHPALAVFSAESGEKEREVPLPDLDEIFNPTWAPDGHAVCFTGMSRGLTDLWIYDFNASRLHRLTDDPYADLQPAWSPDGKHIAFATDRFSSNLQTLAIGAYRLAVIDPDSGAIEQVGASSDGQSKNINPQWSPDGRALLFIGDRDGIPNLHRVSLADRGDSVSRVTNVGTGLSGITISSPALSVATRASRAGVAAFSVYEGGKYDIYTLDLEQAGATGQARRAGLAGRAGETGAVGTSGTLTPERQAADRANAGVLPPLDRGRSQVLGLLNDATFGLPADQTKFDTEEYKPSLGLEAVSQPTIAVGASRSGAVLGGGVALQFGDMLGDRSLTTVFQASSIGTNFSPKDLAAQAVYFDASRRWNWGVVGGQVPYLSGGFTSGVANVGGQDVGVQQSIIFRQTEQSAAGIVAYPFNRAQRVEFQGGLSRISFDMVTETALFSLASGQLLSDNTDSVSIAEPLTLATTSAALVYDTSNFGATSPVVGQRYRLEASPTFGSINFTNLIADYRRYVMPFPFYTVAMRAMHFGRYGSGSQDERLFPLFIGYPSMVRGYDVSTFDPTECVPTTPTANDCPAIDRLVGSRLLVGNLELRFPLLRPFGASQRMYGPVPIEVAVFTDAGVAWNQNEKPSFFGGTREGVASAGFALRVNFFGFAVGEFDFSRPFQRPGAGWVFQFNLAPGF